MTSLAHTTSSPFPPVAAPPPPSTYDWASPSFRRIVSLLLVGEVLTTSFDRFLQIDLAGFNLRICLLFQVILFFLTLHAIIHRQRFTLPLGWASLFTWTLFMVAFVGNTEFLMRNIGYLGWLLIYVANIFSTVNLLHTPHLLQKLLVTYIHTFLFVCSFALFQWLSGVFLGWAPYITSNYFVLGFPRVAGFSYEPSMFANYLVLGWTFVLVLTLRNSTLLPRRTLLFSLALMTAAMFASLARSGIGYILITLALYYAYLCLRALMLQLKGSQLRHFLAISGIFICFSLLAATFAAPYYKTLLAGTGLFGSQSHSFDQRVQHQRWTFQAFQESPIIGYSLGGIAPAIAELNQVKPRSNPVVKRFEGVSIFTEALAASGAIGIIPFIFYFSLLSIAPLWLAHKLRKQNPLASDILYALGISFIGGFLLLQINPNILRSYLWVHMALLTAAYGIYKRYPHPSA